MEILVAYDIATDTPAGRRRLRNVASVCEAHGQRVQKSVFECILNEAQLELLVHRLRREIAADEDSLRIYRLVEPRERHMRVLGVTLLHDLRDPLVV